MKWNSIPEARSWAKELYKALTEEEEVCPFPSILVDPEDEECPLAFDWTFEDHLERRDTWAEFILRSAGFGIEDVTSELFAELLNLADFEYLPFSQIFDFDSKMTFPGAFQDTQGILKRLKAEDWDSENWALYCYVSIEGYARRVLAGSSIIRELKDGRADGWGNFSFFIASMKKLSAPGLQLFEYFEDPETGYRDIVSHYGNVVIQLVPLHRPVSIQHALRGWLRSRTVRVGAARLYEALRYMYGGAAIKADKPGVSFWAIPERGSPRRVEFGDFLE